VDVGSCTITSPAIPANGSCRRTFSGIEQAVKLELQVAIVEANAEIESEANTLRSRTERSILIVITSLLQEAVQEIAPGFPVFGADGQDPIAMLVYTSAKASRHQFLRLAAPMRRRLRI
jgi:hypothetical protein